MGIRTCSYMTARILLLAFHEFLLWDMILQNVNEHGLWSCETLIFSQTFNNFIDLTESTFALGGGGGAPVFCFWCDCESGKGREKIANGRGGPRFFLGCAPTCV